MTLRATFLGLIFAFIVSVVVYFNDHVIQQTYLIGNHFPIIVFGFLILLVLFVNPLINLLGIKKPFKPSEIALIGALGLAVCGWPGSGFFRGFSGVVAMPSNMVKVEASWNATHVMSYVPGGSSLLGEGHIRDWSRLAAVLKDGARAPGARPAGRVWELLSPSGQGIITAAYERGRFEPSERAAILQEINDAISNRDFSRSPAFGNAALKPETRESLKQAQAGKASEREIQKANRILLVECFPDIFMPAPQGEGILLSGGDIQEPAVEDLLGGAVGKTKTGLRQLPWRAWMPTLAVWGSLALLIGIAALCMVIIFQPQWKRELLPFPIARFVQDLTLTSEPGGSPAVLRNKMFWYAFVTIVTIHLINGLHAWFPTFIEIPLRFDFGPLMQLFPRARQHWLSGYMVWMPQLFPTVIAFAFFLSAEVSFSVGISGILYLMFFSLMLSSGIAMENDWLDSRNENLLRFGAYLGIAVVMFFVGRRYYSNVVASSLGLKRHGETPASAVWAARLLCVCTIASVAILSMYNVEWYFGLLLVLIIFLLLVVMTRVNAETGTFFMQPFWMPVGVLVALFGMDSLGPTGYVVMAIMCMIIVGDPREAIMPFIANAMHMVTHPAEKKAPARLAVLIGVVVVAGFFVALAATLYYQYNYGINSMDGWATKAMPRMPFARLSAQISELSAYGQLSGSVAAHGLERLGLMQPNFYLILWIAIGLVLVLACSLFRLRFSWWPLHPVAFVVWGTFPGSWFTASFLTGWLIKLGVLKMSGARGYRTVKPLMIGIIAGELFSAMGWSIFGTIYHLITNLIPISYKIFPG